VSGAANEDVFQRRLAHRYCLDLSGEGLDNFGDEAVCAFALDAHLILQNGGLHVKARTDALGQQSRVVGRVQQTTSPPISLFNSVGVPSATRLPSFMMARRSQRSASSIRCVVTRTETRSSSRSICRYCQRSRRAPGIEAGSGLIQQQHSGMMQQPFGQLNAALHASGKRFHEFLGAIRQTDPRQDFLDPLLQRGAAQTVEMSLMPEIFVGRELEVDTLRLEDDTNLPPHPRWFLCRVATHDGGAPGRRNHQCGKDPEERGLAAAVRTQQAEQFCGAHVERNSVQGRAVFVAMHQILYGNDGAEEGITSGAASTKCRNFRIQRGS
jgi:hypothetical protein